MRSSIAKSGVIVLVALSALGCPAALGAGAASPTADAPLLQAPVPAPGPRMTSPIQGQIFVASQDGKIVKLGGIEILVYDLGTIQSFLSNRVDRIRSRFEELKSEAAVRRSSRDEKLPGYTNVFNARREAEEEVVRQWAELEKGDEALRALRKDIQQLEPKVTELESEIRGLEYEIANARSLAFSPREEKRMIERSVAEREKARQALSPIQAQLDALNKAKAERLDLREEAVRSRKVAEDSLESCRRRENEVRAVLNNATERVEEANAAMAAVWSFESFFACQMPPPQGRTVSDADGRFRFEIPRGGRAFVHARARVPVTWDTPSTGDILHWLVRVDGGKEGPSDLILSNLNLVGTASPDQVLRRE